MSHFLKYPARAFGYQLSSMDKAILLQLLLHHFRFCGSDYDKDFYVTDRDLALVTRCSSRSVWKSKKTLKKFGLIDYFISHGNKTYYKIIFSNGDRS